MTYGAALLVSTSAALLLAGAIVRKTYGEWRARSHEWAFRSFFTAVCVFLIALALMAPAWQSFQAPPPAQFNPSQFGTVSARLLIMVLCAGYLRMKRDPRGVRAPDPAPSPGRDPRVPE